jgi:hypothetical protein
MLSKLLRVKMLNRLDNINLVLCASMAANLPKDLELMRSKKTMF